MAKLYFRYGCMNSGKSMFLLATAHNFQERRIPFAVLKSSVDTRDEGVIYSRAIGKRKCITVTSEDNLRAVVTELKVKPEWVLVDEAQFLTEAQVGQLASVVDDMCINVMCYGLRTDFQTHLFEGSKRLFELADNIEELKSSCSCGRKNVINARIDPEGRILTEGRQILTGAEDAYVAVCRRCYTKGAVKDQISGK